MTVLKAYGDIESEVMRRIARVYRSTTDKVRMKGLARSGVVRGANDQGKEWGVIAVGGLESSEVWSQ